MGCLELMPSFLSGLCGFATNSVRIPHSKIEELALQAQSAGIFAFANTRVTPGALVFIGFRKYLWELFYMGLSKVDIPRDDVCFVQLNLILQT